jgi:hypothetical protein
MNYLELCQTVRQEAGISGTGPHTVANQGGEMRRVVDWVRKAWTDIQNAHRWTFRVAEFTFDTQIGVRAYLPSDIGAPDLLDYKLFGPHDALALEGTPLEVMPYGDFRVAFLLGTAASGRPRVAAPDNSKRLLFEPVPDAAYPVAGEYWRRAQSLSIDADEPLGLDASLHEIIVYRALMLYARFEAASEIYQDAEINYNRLLAEMSLVYLPKTRFDAAEF